MIHKQRDKTSIQELQKLFLLICLLEIHFIDFKITQILIETNKSDFPQTLDLIFD